MSIHAVKPATHTKNPIPDLITYDFSFDCPLNDALINASWKNQTTLTNQRNGSKANPPRKCVDGIKEKEQKQQKANG